MNPCDREAKREEWRKQTIASVTIEELRQELAKRSGAVGLKLCPREPTGPMMVAAIHQPAREIWQAMWDAAPELQSAPHVQAYLAAKRELHEGNTL